MPAPISLSFILRTLERLNTVSRISEKELGEALLPYQGHKRHNVRFLGQYLLDLWELGIRDIEKDEPERLCAECGRENNRDHRGAKYCSHRCRQRAYRNRVTLRKPGASSKCHKGRK